ncbi:MAG TPA: type II toxin-antitoxin system RelE/ParE family toxin [Caulobacteraceae bacterium]|nr:type II toxin-antitoxin system RelE/ParE family toxin [Caulobacteraceae bacterium]
MAQVVWTDRALTSLDSIETYIAQFNPLAARRVARRLADAGNALAHYPERGRPVSGGRRELAAVWPYLIRYSFDGDTVQILRIRHGARRPDGPPP